jgi:hypothetical protein
MQDAEYARFKRGLVVLLDGLHQEFGQERLHQYVRALKALILPDLGRTTTQFVERCQTFGVGNSVAALLREAFAMRSAVEHVHAWDHALMAHAAPDRESLAMRRTRQMEGLACAAYRRILSETDVRDHFRSDESIAAFWALPDEQRRSIWGDPFDVGAVL